MTWWLKSTGVNEEGRRESYPLHYSRCRKIDLSWRRWDGRRGWFRVAANRGVGYMRRNQGAAAGSVGDEIKDRERADPSRTCRKKRRGPRIKRPGVAGSSAPTS